MPSWGGLIELGGTTIWESFNAFNPTRPPEPVKHAKSFNHPALGAIGEWVWRCIVGINPDPSQPGYKHFFVRPMLADGLDFVDASYESIQGLIRVHWRRSGGHVKIGVTVPANTTATVFVPAATIDDVTEGATLAKNADGVVSSRLDGGNALFVVGSGNYEFEVPLE